MVFGSPQQRRIPAGIHVGQATDFAFDTFQQAAPTIRGRGRYTGLEPLAPAEGDFLTTCAEACRLLDRLDHPSFALHLDVKAMTSEATPIPELIAQECRPRRAISTPTMPIAAAPASATSIFGRSCEHYARPIIPAG